MLNNQLWDKRTSFIEPLNAFFECSSYVMKLLSSNKGWYVYIYIPWKSKDYVNNKFVSKES